MKSEWKKCKLGDVCTNSGSYGIAASSVDYSNQLPTYLRITDINDDGTICSEGLKSVDDPNALKYCIEENDIVFARTGASTGRNYFYNPSDGKFVFAGFLIKFSIDPQKVNPKYIKYYCLSKVYKDWIHSFSMGSTRGNINAKTYLNMPIILPNRNQQDLLVDILSALDAKIENNNAINKNLEAQAQALFKSWFVDFEPFGGVMPSFAKIELLGNLCEIVTKGTTPTTLGRAFTRDGINFIKAESITDTHSFDISKFDHIDDETNLLLKRSIIQEKDILFSIAGTLGRFVIVPQSVLPANTNQAVAIIRVQNNVIDVRYLYSFFVGNWHKIYYNKRVQQAVQANLSLTTIKSLPIIVLNGEWSKRYCALIGPIFEHIENNTEENTRLAALRDTLLPKLMSGEIEV